MIKNLYFILAYNHIWLNLSKDKSHFFYIFLLMIITLATNQNSEKNHFLASDVSWDTVGLNACSNNYNED